MNSSSPHIRHNTPLSEQPAKLVTVTHPYHALFGQQFEFVGLRNGKQQIVVIRLPRGNTARLPLEYTDYKATPVMFGNNSSTSSETLLSVEGLLQVIKLVDVINKRQSLCVKGTSKG